MAIVFWASVAAVLALLVVLSGFRWERDGKWRACWCGKRYMMRRWFRGQWQYRVMNADEEADFFSREAW